VQHPPKAPHVGGAGLARCWDRLDGSAPYVGTEPRPSSAYPLHRAGRRHLLGRQGLDSMQTWVLPASPRAIAAVPASVLEASGGDSSEASCSSSPTC